MPPMFHEIKKVHSELTDQISSPFFHNNQLYFASRSTGDIFRLNDNNKPLAMLNTSGSPSGMAMSEDEQIYIADVDHRAIVLGTGDDDEMQVVVAMYEDKEFLGPNSICFGQNGTFFFTDSGPFGETGLHNPKGSVYCVTGGSAQMMLKPIILDSLAYPTGLTLSPNGEVLYVCEMMTNRLLRFVKQAAAWHCSVFCQFAGRIGPAAVCSARDGLLYVGFKGIRAGGDTGCVKVVDQAGKVVDEIIIDGAASITGVCIDSSESYLYATDETGNVHRIAL